MTDINSLNSGKTFTVNKRAHKDVSKMNFIQQAEEVKAQNAFAEKHFGNAAENGKVEILLSDESGTAVISGHKVSLPELGKAAPEIALELKQYDKNSDNYLEEKELIKTWGQHAKSAAVSVGVSTAAGAGTGAGVGAWFAGVGAIPGALVGALVTGVPTALWEIGSGFFTVGYQTPEWLR